MTTKGSGLDGFKLDFEEMKPKKRKINKANIYLINKPKRQSVIKAYFKYLVEVILK